MIRLHPRHEIVTQASIALSKAVVEVLKDHDLTHAEIQSLFIEQMLRWNKYAIHDEREEEK